MNFPNFIARRIAFTDSQSFTKVIIRIAIAAVAISVATMIITSATIEGFKKEIRTKVFGFWGHIHLTDTNINRTFEQVPIEKNPAYLADIMDIGQLEYQAPVEIFGTEIKGKYRTKETKGGVQRVQPYALAPGILSTKEDIGAIVLKGVDPSFDWQYLPRFIVDGDSLLLSDNEVNKGVVISSNTARLYKLEVGKRFLVSFIKDGEETKKAFKVKGIFNTGLEEYDKVFALVDIRVVQDVLGWSSDEITGFEIFLDDPDDLDIVSEYIYNDILPGRLYAETIMDKFPSIFDWLKLSNINEIVILALMIIVAIINMITILLVFILERTRMIGLLKALGSNDWDIRKIFLYNAGYIILFGLIFGNILGLGFCFLQDHFKFIKLDEANYYLTYAPIWIKWFDWVLINVLTFVVTIAFLIMPTYIISKILPVKTIVFD